MMFCNQLSVKKHNFQKTQKVHIKDSVKFGSMLCLNKCNPSSVHARQKLHLNCFRKRKDDTLFQQNLIINSLVENDIFKVYRNLKWI